MGQVDASRMEKLGWPSWRRQSFQQKEEAEGSLTHGTAVSGLVSDVSGKVGPLLLGYSGGLWCWRCTLGEVGRGGTSGRGLLQDCRQGRGCGG